ncbi:MAG: uroporphyrinogen-III C-methyltransferase [Myxococcales bacterium]
MGTGKVYLVGAGPGDPKLLTLRGAEVLGLADAILVDSLVGRGVLVHARPGAQVRQVGKRAGRRGPSQEEITGELIALALQGLVVVRLKGGDPFVFGRGGEEAEALAEAGVPFEVVPGVSSGIGALAYAGIPLLHRALSSTATFVSGHLGTLPPLPQDGTVVIFMGGARIAKLAASLLETGRPPSTPVALVALGTTPEQRVRCGTLGELRFAGPQPSPTIAVVGEVAALARKLRWFGATPMPLCADEPRGPGRSRRTGEPAGLPVMD